MQVMIYVKENLIFHLLCREKTQVFPTRSFFLLSLFTTYTEFILLVTKCVEVFLHTKQFSETQAGCPSIELNSDALYLEIAANPTGEGFSPARRPPSCPPLPRPNSASGCKPRSSITCAPNQPALDQCFQRPPRWV